MKKKLRIAMERQYATEKNLHRIAEIAPHARTAIFRIEERYPLIRKLRGVLRRVLPFSAYAPLAKHIDPIAEAQISRWIVPPLPSPDMCDVLLFPPGLERDIGENLVKELTPRWIHSVTTGVDRISPMAKNILLTSSKGVHSERIAEFAMGLIFAMAKHIPRFVLQNRARIWKSLPSLPIRGSRLGIVGLGGIGTEVARLGSAVGMEVWATRRKPEKPEFVNRLLVPEELPILLGECDYVVLSVPLTSKTRHLIGAKELNMMKKSACLVNVSRGAVVEEDALFDALKHSRIRGACIDVFQDEKPLPRNSRFYQLPNLLITDFSAYHSADSTDQVMELFFENLKRFCQNEPLRSMTETSDL